MNIYVYVLCKTLSTTCTNTHPKNTRLINSQNSHTVAATSAVVVSGAARFTVLTSRVIRIEYADNSKFEDRATMAIVNRKTAVPKFTSGVKQGVLIIETNDVVLSYLVGASFEDAGALNVTSKSSEGVRWQYGMTSAQDTGNLLGTIRTLDRQEQLTLNCSLNMNRNFNPNIEHESDNMWEGMHCAWGLVSRSGWALYDDQKSAVLDSDFWCVCVCVCVCVSSILVFCLFIHEASFAIPLHASHSQVGRQWQQVFQVL
jgi:hypothetical protein